MDADSLLYKEQVDLYTSEQVTLEHSSLSLSYPLYVQWVLQVQKIVHGYAY